MANSLPHTTALSHTFSDDFIIKGLAFDNKCPKMAIVGGYYQHISVNNSYTFYFSTFKKDLSDSGLIESTSFWLKTLVY